MKSCKDRQKDIDVKMVIKIRRLKQQKKILQVSVVEAIDSVRLLYFFEVDGGIVVGGINEGGCEAIEESWGLAI